MLYIMQSLESLQRWTLKQSGLLESQRSSGIMTGFWISVSGSGSMVMISTFGRLLLDCASDELDESSKGAMSPESGMGSSRELLSGATEELLELSDDDGEEIRGTPATSGGSIELLLGFVAEESASSAELLRRSWLVGISRTLELLDMMGSQTTSPHVGSGDSMGPMGSPDSDCPRHALKEKVDAMPSAVAMLPFMAVDSFAFPVTFFFSIFINKPEHSF